MGFIVIELGCELLIHRRLKHSLMRLSWQCRSPIWQISRKSLKFRSIATGILSIMMCIFPEGAEADDAVQLPESVAAHSWEAGQRMFYSDPYWRGGDCASSVDLGDGHVLWLFADSYVGVEPPYIRDYCCVNMIRNCMGIQKGYDPSTADFNVYWRSTEENPSAYFPCDDTSWYWPGNAVKIDSFLVVFLMHLCPSDSGLGFRECEVYPHAAFLVSHIERDPLEWAITRLVLPESRFGIMLGAATLMDLPYLYMFNVDIQEQSRSMFLCRWDIDSLLMGSVGAIE